jgi:hypothetical protein
MTASAWMIAVWMVAASVTSWLGVVAVVGWKAGIEVFCGMLGPLAAASGTSLVTERIYKRRPESLTRLMMAAFLGKMIFFGAYVAVMLRVLSLRPVPFVTSFIFYFIVLYLTEALYLRRLFSGRSP